MRAFNCTLTGDASRYIVIYRRHTKTKEHDMHDVLYWRNVESPFDMEKIRRLVAWRQMSGGGRGRRHFGPGGRPPGPPFGRGPWEAPLFGGMPGGPGFGRRRRASRGDVRTAAVLLLAEEPRNGYQIMQELEERSDGLWRPSPGSVYPALQQLEDEGLIRSEETEGRRLYHLTDAGRAYVAERPEDQPAPWETFTDTVSDQHGETAALMRDGGMAFAQVMRAGSEAQLAEASKVLAETRRSLYRILAEGEPGEEDAE
jgi:DNA-binding PadR family transcriptional regulator